MSLETDGKRIMTLDQIVDEIIRLIRTRDELGGYFQQEPCKGDFFQLFVAGWDGSIPPHRSEEPEARESDEYYPGARS